MKPREVFWSSNAIDDVIQIAEYVAQDNLIAARKIAKLIRETGDNLGDIATGRPGRVDKTYEKIVANMPYIIAYRIAARPREAEAIYILHVIHMSRDWQASAWPEG